MAVDDDSLEPERTCGAVTTTTASGSGETIPHGLLVADTAALVRFDGTDELRVRWFSLLFLDESRTGVSLCFSLACFTSSVDEDMGLVVVSVVLLLFFFVATEADVVNVLALDNFVSSFLTENLTGVTCTEQLFDV